MGTIFFIYSEIEITPDSSDMEKPNEATSSNLRAKSYISIVADDASAKPSDTSDDPMEIVEDGTTPNKQSEKNPGSKDSSQYSHKAASSKVITVFLPKFPKLLNFILDPVRYHPREVPHGCPSHREHWTAR